MKLFKKAHYESLFDLKPEEPAVPAPITIAEYEKKPCCTYTGPPFVKCDKCGGRQSV